MAAPPLAPGTAPAPRLVARFEAALLRILRFFMRQGPADSAMQHITGKAQRPKCLSANAVYLVQDDLRKGCVRYLVQAGGWRREAFLRQGEPRGGRLWERWPEDELRLSFSPHTLDFLIWLTAISPKEGAKDTHVWNPPVAALTVADQLFLFLAYECLRSEADAGGVLRGRAGIAANPLCRLMYPQDFGHLTDPPVLDFARWMTGVGAAVLEALQPLLARRWLALEQSKRMIGDWHALGAVGLAQERVLTAFLDALETANRQDLARFLYRTAGRLLAADLPLDFWFGGLHADGPTRLADRLDIRRQTLAFLRAVLRLDTWHEASRAVQYFDENYAASQAVKADWEAIDGAVVAARARDLLRQVEPLARPATATD